MLSKPRQKSWRRSSALFAFLVAVSIVLEASLQTLHAFALMGPYADWMDVTNSYRMGWDVGGPVDITEGYRWNVPVVTYGFDQSFLDYFGSNGVNAVEQAFQILNDLPPASMMVPTNYQAFSVVINYAADSRLLLDLKTATLGLLLEQLGLAEPQRSIFVLKQWSTNFLSDSSISDWPESVITNYVIERNFDPQTLAPTHYVNGLLFVGSVIDLLGTSANPEVACVETLQVDPLPPDYTATADLRSSLRPLSAVQSGPGVRPGQFFFSLTMDDIGGLRYLLSSNTVNVELLLPDVHGAGTNASSYVNVAPRPGIEKITFVPQPYDSLLGRFSTLTNQFTDTFLTNGAVQHQQLERVATQPDFLFSAIDVSQTNSTDPFFVRTGAANWWNSRAASGSLGPGVIRPPVRIAFNQLGPCVQTDEVLSQRGQMEVTGYHWASFDNSTNPPATYPPSPVAGSTNELTVHLWLQDANGPFNNKGITWTTPVPLGNTALLQTSTNLSDWVSLGALTNEGVPVTWAHYYELSSRYFRVLPQ